MFSVLMALTTVPAAAGDAQVHPIHGLTEAARTCVWNKPYRKLFANRRYQSERLIFRDTGTGAEIWRLTFDPHPDGVSYANRFPWSADGSWLMFGSRARLGGYWHMFLTPDGEHVTQVAGASRLAHPRWRRGRPDELLSAAGKELVSFNVRTGKQQTVATIPKNVPGRPAFGPHGRWAAVCKQGFGEDGVLTVIEIGTGKSRRVKLRTASADFNGDWLYSGRVTYVGATPHAGYSLNHLPHLSREHPYQQWLMNLETGEYRQVRYLSHGGTSPEADRKVGYAGGAIYTTDFFGDDRKFVMNIGTGGHIAWMSSPDWCVAGNSGAPGRSPFACQLVQVYVDTGNWRRIAHGQTANTTYASHLFCNTSPDGTKVEYSSTMLGPRDMYWAVMQRPAPPERLRGVRRGNAVRLQWDQPAGAKEYAGARIWRAAASGGPYRLISGARPIRATAWTDPEAPMPAYYVATSMEHSTLESRRFSNEVAPTEGAGAWPGKVRRYVEAEIGRTSRPMAVNFHGTASCDLFVEHRHGKGEGSVEVRVDLPRKAAYHIWARVRAVNKAGPITVRGADASGAGVVRDRAWTWIRLAPALPLARGAATLRLEAGEPGLGVDKLLVTDDAGARPVGFGDTEGPGPAPVTRLTATAESAYEVRLAWTASASPAVHHVDIHRLREPGQAIGQTSRVASPSGVSHLDWGLTPGARFEYAVTAVDTFGRKSEPTRIAVSTPPVERCVIQVEAETGRVEGGELTVVKDAHASGDAYVQTAPEKLESKYRLRVPFTVDKADDYMLWVSMFPLKDRHIYQVVSIDGERAGLMYMGSERKGPTSRRLLWRPLGAVSGVTPLIWRLAPGRHTIEVRHVGRPGYTGRFHAIDQFVVTNDRSFTPPGPTWDWQ